MARDVQEMNVKTAFEDCLTGKKILVTGHTGFTGSWVCLWLQSIGAEIAGYSLPPETSPSLFNAAGLDKDIATTIGDIADYNALHRAVSEFQPNLILHLA